MSKDTAVKTERPLSDGAKAVYEAMVSAGKPLTMAEVREMGVKASPAHFTALRTRGLISSEKVEREVVRVTKSKVNEYTLIDQE